MENIEINGNMVKMGYKSYATLTHLFPMHPFFSEKHKNTLRQRKGALGTNGLIIPPHIVFNQVFCYHSHYYSLSFITIIVVAVIILLLLLFYDIYYTITYPITVTISTDTIVTSHFVITVTFFNI